MIEKDTIFINSKWVASAGRDEQALALSWLSHRVCIGLIALNIAQEALTRSLE